MQPVSKFKSKSGLKRIFSAFFYSVAGLKTAWSQEHAFRQEVAMFVCGTTAALLMPLFLIEKLMLIGALLLVLIVELMNSAIEAVVDRVSLEYHPLSKNAKDIGSAAVLLTCVLAAATWLTILAEHFYLQPADGKLNFPRSKYALIIDRG
ncbi:diacylglycerol kinase (plasmid) [Massilia varians]